MRRGRGVTAGPSRPSKTTAVSAHERALRCLARRDHSQQELRRVLQRNGHPTDEVEAVVLRLRQAGLLDDSAYAARFTRTKLAHSGQGSRRILGALRQRGVAGEDAETGVRQALGDVSETDALDAAARRFWRTAARHEPRERMKRMWVHLMRRGFPGQLVRDRIAALWPRFEDALDGLDPIDDERDDE